MCINTKRPVCKLSGTRTAGQASDVALVAWKQPSRSLFASEGEQMDLPREA